MRISRAICAALIALATTAPALAGPVSQNVALLHGLARSAASMEKLEDSLSEAGFKVCNIDYPSRHHRVQRLASDYVTPSIMQCFGDTQKPINFVTHSLGGIIVRQIAATDDSIVFGRVVMLGPPNRGSEVVDKLGDWTLFQAINGPAGNQLGTAPDDLPRSLGPATFETGVIAGSFSINLILSSLIPGEDDGKVSIENTKLEGMKDFTIVGASHPFIMRDSKAIALAHQFLLEGAFPEYDNDE
jgi:pimeloyl-ACP methyl ester carboxylesterase